MPSLKITQEEIEKAFQRFFLPYKLLTPETEEILRDAFTHGVLFACKQIINCEPTHEDNCTCIDCYTKNHGHPPTT